MKTPKSLPYHARRAGIPFERAVSLWHDALRHATETTGWVGSSDYWQAAQDYLFSALEAEQRCRLSPPLRQWTRTQQQIARLPLQALQDLAQAWRHTQPV